ncbi:MAG TPA: ABC transporter substrate-binding protein [Lachnospiraceae bacterium]|jgi:TRAP-type C4-dicarboxylate transport system permease small subunit|nr:ABC transporter substrate-binding protein [Lachnospiraceae bacterium]
MKRAYEKFCRFEEKLALVLLAGLAVLVFISALMRTFKHPLNWAQDVALVAFAWLIFIGGDVAVRGSGLIGVDMVVSKLPKSVQKWLDVFYKCLIIAFLCVLVFYGIRMVRQGWSRQIAALGISYGWVTLAVPVGSFLMIISTAISLVKRIKTPAGQAVSAEKARDIG